MRKTIRKLRRQRRVVQGPGFFAYALDTMLGKQRLHCLTVAGHAVHVRSCTPDLNVAIRILTQNEYAHLRCKDPLVIIDAGANIGASTLFFAEAFPSAKVVGIEPEEGNFRLLQKNTETCSNVIAVKAALWGSNDTRMIQNRFTGEWGFTVSDSDNKTEATGQEVECITMKTLMERHGITHIDLLKMDIEGAEKDVFEHAAGWIGAVDIITVELHDRISMGCDRAFYLATRDFVVFEKHGEKVTAYRA
jgi:FkbM family methyltransferase